MTGVRSVERHQVELDVMRTLYLELRRLTPVERARAIAWAQDRITYEATQAPKTDSTPQVTSKVFDASPFKDGKS